jgi:hypothetical protein
LRLSEKFLETHDLTLTLPKYQQEEKQQFFRLLLLSASDISDPATALPRVERLYHLAGGRHVGIIFLLQEKTSGNNGTFGYMNLQARHADLDSSSGFSADKI